MDFQFPATKIMMGIVDFHNDVMVLLIVVIVFVSTILASIIYYFRSAQGSHVIRNNITSHQQLEFA